MENEPEIRGNLNNGGPTQRDQPPAAEERRKLSEKELNELLPPEMFKSTGAKGKELRKYLNLLALACGLMIIILFIFLLMFSSQFRKGFISEQAVADENIILSDEENGGLEKFFREYEEIYLKAGGTPGGIEFATELNANQVNYLLEKINREETFKPGERERSVVRVYPDGEILNILMTIPVKEGKFINITAKGRAFITDYRFRMDMESLETGDGRKSMFLKKRFIDRINRELDSIPENMELPFRIKDMKVSDSKFILNLHVKNQEGQL